MEEERDTSYEEFAEDYLFDAGRKPFNAAYERPFIKGILPSSMHGKHVLDLGCATGYYSRLCIDRGARVTAVDISEKMVERTREICGEKIETFAHDISEPFSFLQDNTVDWAIASLVMHYLEDWTATLSEIRRVLIPGGVFIASTHHPVMDYTLFNQNNYFNRRMVEDTWEGFRKPLKVRYFVRPLSQYLQPLIGSGLILRGVYEPKPVKELLDTDRKTWERLEKKPAFLFFKMEKPCK